MAASSAPFASLLVPLASVCALAAAAPALGQGERGHQSPQAEAFVQSQAQRVLTVLSDRSLSVSAKEAELDRMIDQVADVPRITSFVLGRYRRSLTPAQYEAFSRAFRAYADGVWESRLGEYRGQTLKVTGSVERRPGDVVVESEVTGGGKPTVVEWRVMREPDGAWKVVDVDVAGVWLAITEQQDFTASLDNHHGDIDRLIEQLRQESGGRAR